MSKVILRKYGEATIIPFSLFKIDGIDFKTDAVWVLGDVKLMKNEGAEANITVGFVDEGQGYSQALTAGNMQFARGKLYIADQSTKVWLDTDIYIETYGHASAQHPNMGNGSESRLAELDAANLPQDIADVAALVTAAAPIPYTPDASSVIITGTETSGTYASTATDDNTRWIITDAGAGIEVVTECNLGAGRLATSLRINGFFDAGASRIVEIYIYNYTTASYDKLSAGTSATEMRKNTSDKDYEFALTSANTDPSISIGEVKIKFLSAQSNTGDTLNLDYVVATGEASGASSGAAIADAIANSDWGESVNHIPRFTGELFYIEGSAGDDGNSGKYPDSGLATISATVVKADVGDYLKVFAASFDEAVDLNKDGLELHGEIGATITGNGGVPLTISANDCKVDEIILTPAAGQIGLIITGNYNKISILRVNGGLTAVQDTGIGNKITLVEADEYTGTGFDLQGTGARLLKCFAISSQSSTRGFYLSNTAADRTIIEESTSVNNDTAGFEVVAGVTNALIADCVESVTCGTRVDNGTNTSWRNHSTTDHQLLQATQEAVLSRLASSVFGTDVCPTAVTVTDGDILSGTYLDARTINQTYLKVQETGQFKIDFDFTDLTSTEDKINVIYRYFGEGSTNHKVECLMWNYQTLVWDDMLATERDFPSSEEDNIVEIEISGTVSDYFDGISPNITARVRIYHISNANPAHEFWVDFITLGELEQIYVPADNVGITAIDEILEHTTYGLAALRDRGDAAWVTGSGSIASVILAEKVETLLDINKPLDLTVNTTTRLQYQWLDIDGEPVNINGSTFIFKAVKNAGESSPAIAEVTGTIVDDINGRFYFDILPTTVFKGRYEIWATDGVITTLTMAGGARIETHPRL